MTPTPTKIADSLLPCPFCGYQGNLNENGAVERWYCRGCGAVGPKRIGTAEGAITAWNRRTPSPDHRAAAAEIDALAEKATQGPMRSMREGNQYLDGLHSADGKSLVGASRVDGLARPWNRGGAALFIDMEHVSRFRDADADFIAWCFNHRTEISRALGGAVGDRYAEGYAAAREDAAKLAKGEVYKERYRQWPWYGEGNKSADSEVVVFADALATAIRALKPQGGEE